MKLCFPIPIPRCSTRKHLYIVTINILKCSLGQEGIYSMELWGWIPFSSCDLQRDGKLTWAGLEYNLVLVWHITDHNHAVPSTDNYMNVFIDLGLRSNYKTPLRGLYLCGSGAHPGGGVMGAPGRNAARLVLQEVGERTSVVIYWVMILAQIITACKLAWKDGSFIGILCSN